MYLRIRTIAPNVDRIITFRAFEATAARLTLLTEQNKVLSRVSLKETLQRLAKAMDLSLPKDLTYKAKDYFNVFKELDLIYLLQLENERKICNISLRGLDICKINVDSVTFLIENQRVADYEVELVSCQVNRVGYRRFNLILASSDEKRQSTLALRKLR